MQQESLWNCKQKSIQREQKKTEQRLYEYLNFYCYIGNDRTVMELLYGIKNCDINDSKLRETAEIVINELSII